MVVETPAFTPKRIRKLRQRLGLNQTEFGKRVGVSQQLVTQWENNVIRPSRYAHIIALIAMEQSE